jgi:hypothetical protein
MTNQDMRPYPFPSFRQYMLNALLILYCMSLIAAWIYNLWVGIMFGMVVPRVGLYFLPFALLGLLEIIGLFGIFIWRKWGVYLFGSAVGVVSVVTLIVMGFVMTQWEISSMIALWGIVGGGAIIFFVSLQWERYS